MKHVIVSIMDKAVNCYGRPFVTRTPEEAIRTVKIEVNRPGDNNMLNTHPEDYTLYQVGFWDDDQGRVWDNDGPPVRLIECINLWEDVGDVELRQKPR